MLPGSHPAGCHHHPKLITKLSPPTTVCPALIKKKNQKQDWLYSPWSRRVSRWLKPLPLLIGPPACLPALSQPASFFLGQVSRWLKLRVAGAAGRAVGGWVLTFKNGTSEQVGGQRRGECTERCHFHAATQVRVTPCTIHLACH